MRAISGAPAAPARLVIAVARALVRWAAHQLFIFGVFYVAGRVAWRLLTRRTRRRAVRLRSLLKEIEAEARAELNAHGRARGADR